MSSLGTWLESIYTTNYITYWIIQCLTEWPILGPFPYPHTDLPGLLQAMEAQYQMAWMTSIFQGCIMVEWASMPEVYFLWLRRHNTGKLCATSLVV